MYTTEQRINGSTPSRLRRFGIGAAFCLAFGMAFGVGSDRHRAEAYRFFDGRADPYFSGRVVGPDAALRWASEVWAPGATLAWEIAADPDYEVVFGGPQGALPFVRSALAAWTEVATADISWSAEGVAEEDVDESNSQNGRNSIFVDTAGSAALLGYAAVWSRPSAIAPSTWEITECDVGLGSFAGVIPESVLPEEIGDYLEEARRDAVYTLVHEFGHCLGLAHAGALSISGHRSPLTEELEHPGDPAMSYGVVQDQPADLSADDVAGGSLLRPAAGFRAGTGGISGTLQLDGEPAAWVHVWALPLEGDTQQDRVGGFTNRDGEFRIEGLSPGDYTFWAHPIIKQNAHSLLMYNGAPLDLDDTLAGLPVRVEAGEMTDGVRIPMRIGRAGRPPDGIPDSATRSAIAGSTGPCSGVRVGSWGRPYPADGPFGSAEPGAGEGRGNRERWVRTVIFLEWLPEAGNVVFDWSGLYRNWFRVPVREEVVHITPPRAGSPFFDMSIPQWRIERDGPLVRHSLEIAWPESAEAGLRFRSESDTCPGDPMLLCDATAGCMLTQ